MEEVRDPNAGVKESPNELILREEEINGQSVFLIGAKTKSIVGDLR